MSAKEHPFIPGARVAITNGWDNWHAGEVDKVYKTGRFTLKGSPQQWKAIDPSYSGYWRAFPTSRDSWSRTSLRLWDDAADAEIKEIFAAQARKKRRRWLHDRLGRISDDALTDAMLDQIEAALPKPDAPSSAMRAGTDAP